jgi:hypothetical protein
LGLFRLRCIRPATSWMCCTPLASCATPVTQRRCRERSESDRESQPHTKNDKQFLFHNVSDDKRTAARAFGRDAGRDKETGPPSWVSTSSGKPRIMAIGMVRDGE